MSRRRIGLVSLVVVILPLAVGTVVWMYHALRPSTPQPLTIGMPALEQNALLYVAEAQGFYTRNGLDVTIREYDTGVDSVNALLAGEVEIAELAEFPFLRPVLEGHPLRILAVNDRFENDYLLVRTGRGITTAADLRGKQIGVIRGTILEFYLGRFLALNGVRLDEVTVVDTISAQGTIDAIVGGELDAVVAFQPHVQTIQTRLGEGVVTWPVQNDQLVYGVLVADAVWLDANQDVVERLLRSLAQAEQYLVTHPDQARVIVADRLGLDADYLAAVWPLHRFALSLEFSLIVAANDEVRWMLDQGLVPAQAIPNLVDSVYLDGLKAVKPEAVSISP